MRYVAIIASLAGVLVFGLLIPFGSLFVALFGLSLLATAIGVWDILQTKHSLRRNYPILANIRFFLEKIRTEIRQYFLESDTDGTPFNREKRSIVYQRAKGQLDKRPFGTQLNVYSPAFEWLHHSIVARHPSEEPFRVSIGGPDCKQPYAASIFNISAMSFGSLSKNAILALNHGAKIGNFAHNTGEGGISPYHLDGTGDLIWQIGTGYFGCRHNDGTFDETAFAERAAIPQVK